MTTYLDHPEIGPLKSGQDARIYLRIIYTDVALVEQFRDLTGATGTFTFVPNTGNVTDEWTSPLVLDGDPAAEPQGYVAVAGADTNALEPDCPVQVQVYGNVTMADTKIDVPSFEFTLLKGVQ